MTKQEHTRNPSKKRTSVNQRVDISGKRYGRLLVTKYHSVRKKHHQWMCRCDCGVEKTVSQSALKQGQQSCGCLGREATAARNIANATHGHSQEPWFGVYNNMRTRCENKNNKAYQNYGARGIKVCKEWLDDPKQFHKDMGDRPEGKTLERKENNKGYSKDNCRWATPAEQSQNRRSNKLNAELVIEMRKRYSKGHTMEKIHNDLAKNASIDAVKDALSFKTWKNII